MLQSHQLSYKVWKECEGWRNIHIKAKLHILDFSTLFCSSCQFYRLVFFLFLRVGMADTTLRSKVCIVDVTLQLLFTSTYSPTSNSVLSTLSKCKYMVSKERWEVVSVGMLSAIIVLMDWKKNHQKKMRCQLLAGFTWEAGWIPRRAMAFSECCLLEQAQCCSPHSWAVWAKTASSQPTWGCSFASESPLRKAKPCSVSTSLSYFFRSGISATLMLPQQRLSKYICRKSLTTMGYIPISNARKTTGADFKNISLFRRQTEETHCSGV